MLCGRQQRRSHREVDHGKMVRSASVPALMCQWSKELKVKPQKTLSSHFRLPRGKLEVNKV